MRHPLFIPATLAALALAVRLLGLGDILTADEPRWIFRADSFYRALATGDPGGTFQGTHPGVLPMLLIGGGVELRKLLTGEELRSPQVGSFRLAAKLPIVVAVSLAVGSAAGLAGTIWGQTRGTLLGALLALEPTFVGFSQLAHLDALLSILLLLSILALLRYRRSGHMRDILLSALFGGAAVATKLPALVLLPIVPLLLIGQKRTPRKIVRAVAVWWGASALLFLLLWPSMWLNLVPNLRYATRDVGAVVRIGHPNLEDAPSAGAGGALAFYARAAVARLTPLSLLLAVCGIVLAHRVSPRAERADARLLALFAIAFLSALGGTAKRADRYLLPVLLTLLPFTALALEQIWRVRLVGKFGAVLALVILGLLTVRASPYALAYESPLTPVEEPTQSGWGEGLEALAAKLNTHPLARNLVVATWYPAVFREFFLGQTMSLSSRHDGRVTHVVLYRNMRGRGPESPATEILREYADVEPTDSVFVEGREVARVYETDSLALYETHTGELSAGTEIGELLHTNGASVKGVRIAFATFSGRPAGGTVRIHLAESPGGPPLRRAEIRAADLTDREWREVSFEPLRLGSGRPLYLSLHSRDGRPESSVAVFLRLAADLRGGPVFILRRPLRFDEAYADFARAGDLAAELVSETR